jgi:UV DNA damage endonuclease
VQVFRLAAAVAELEYHDRLLSALGADASHTIVLHVGSGSGDAGAPERFAAGFAQLSDDARARLVLENDERWPLDRVLSIAEPLELPVVFDAFHHRLAPSRSELDTREAVRLAGRTWSPQDGRQEVHFSTQEQGKRAGAHAQTIDLAALGLFLADVGDLPLDCILEVKDKERSVLKAQELLHS